MGKKKVAAVKAKFICVVDGKGELLEGTNDQFFNIQEAEYAIALFMIKALEGNELEWSKDKTKTNFKILAPTETQRNLMREILENKKNVSKITSSVDINYTIMSLSEYEAAGLEKTDKIIVSTCNSECADECTDIINAIWYTAGKIILVSSASNAK